MICYGRCVEKLEMMNQWSACVQMCSHAKAMLNPWSALADALHQRFDMEQWCKMYLLLIKRRDACKEAMKGKFRVTMSEMYSCSSAAQRQDNNLRSTFCRAFPPFFLLQGWTRPLNRVPRSCTWMRSCTRLRLEWSVRPWLFQCKLDMGDGMNATRVNVRHT